MVEDVTGILHSGLEAFTEEDDLNMRLVCVDFTEYLHPFLLTITCGGEIAPHLH